MKENSRNTEEIIFSPRILELRKGYNLSLFTKDIIAGLIVAIIAIPLSIALALSSGVGVKSNYLLNIFPLSILMHLA